MERILLPLLLPITTRIATTTNIMVMRFLKTMAKYAQQGVIGEN